MKIKDENHIISFITNFGCHGTCPYCIVKKSGMKINKTTIKDIPELKRKIIDSGNGLVSLSGGGDPLFEYERHTDFYAALFTMLFDIQCRLELHTSYIDSGFMYGWCYRVVYHLTGLSKVNDISKIKRHALEKTRIVFVVEDCYTENDINYIYGKYKENKDVDQLSFRQLVYPDFTVSHHLEDFLVQGHNEKKWYFIRQGDYNEYFVNGKTEKEFKAIKCINKNGSGSLT